MLNEIKTFEEITQYSNDVLELLSLVEKYKDVDLEHELYNFAEHTHGKMGYAYDLQINKKSLCSVGYYTIESDDTNDIILFGEKRRHFHFWQTENNFFSISHAVIVGKEQIYDVLKLDELTEEMYNQLIFLHDTVTINSIFFASRLLLMKRQFGFYENTHYEVHQVLEDIKRILKAKGYDI